jgi:single-strand DNA-binding protein
MAGINIAMIEGNLTRDAHINELQSGMCVINFSVAHNSKYKAASGEEKEVATFVDCKLWTKHPDKYRAMLVKGAMVFAKGVIFSEQWTNPKDQTKRSRTGIKVDDVFLVREPSGTRTATPQPKSPDTPDQPEAKADREWMPF